MIRNRSPVHRIVPALPVFFTAALAIPVPTMAQEAPAPPPGAVEGIKVHGHWVIEVRNPDGTLDTRQEFDNALGVLGAESLAQLLGRTVSAGFWIVALQSASGGPCDNNGQPFPCRLQEPADSRSSSFAFSTLTVEVSTYDLVLSGTATAVHDGTIDEVHTALYRCTPDLAPDDPAACQQTLGDQFYPFTNTTLGSPVSVVAGQQILVTVTMSFS